jgi:hypothetical protein
MEHVYSDRADKSQQHREPDYSQERTEDHERRLQEGTEHPKAHLLPAQAHKTRSTPTKATQATRSTASTAATAPATRITTRKSWVPTRLLFGLRY